MSKLEELYDSDPLGCACALGFLSAVPRTSRVGWVGDDHPLVLDAVAEHRSICPDGPWDDLLVMQFEGDVAVDRLEENGVLHVLTPSVNELGLRADARRAGFNVFDRVALRADGIFTENGSADDFVLLRLSRMADSTDEAAARPVALMFDHPGWLGETHEKLRLVLSALGYELRELTEREAAVLGHEQSDEGWRLPDDIARVGVNRVVGLSEDIDAMMRTFFEGETNPDLEQELAQLMSATYRGLRRVIASSGAALVVTMNGTTPLGHTAAEAARAEGVATLALENSFLRDRFFAEPITGAVGNRHSLARLRFDRRRFVPLTSPEEMRLDAYLAGRDTASSFDGAIRQDAPIGVAEVRKQLDIPDGDRIAVLLGQVAFDSVITLDNPHFASSAAFLEAVMEDFRGREGWTLVIRLHPKEAVQGEDCTRRRLESLGPLPDNARLVAGRSMNTYSIMAAASVGLTINSQTGLELISQGKPCLVAGDAFYANKGFTRDLPSATLLGPAIDDLVTRCELEDAERDLSRRFLHELVYDFTVPYDIAGLQETLPHRLREGRTLPPVPRPRQAVEVTPGMTLIIVDCEELDSPRTRAERACLESGRVEVIRIDAQPGAQIGGAVREALSLASCPITAVVDTSVIIVEHTIAVLFERGLSAGDHITHLPTSPHVEGEDSLQIAIGNSGAANGFGAALSISGHAFVGRTPTIRARAGQLEGAESLWECGRLLGTIDGAEHLDHGDTAAIPVRVPRRIDDLVARSRAVARSRRRQGEIISRTPDRTAETLETLLELLASTSPAPTATETEHLRDSLSRLLVVLMAAPLEFEPRPAPLPL